MDDSVKLRVFIAEDEPPARDRLRRHLEKIGGVEIVAEAADGATALAMLETMQPDVLLLDINMPGLDGLRLLQALDDPPAVIFTTAYEHHAVTAFELDAVDYLLKPFSAERLAKALDRVRRQLVREPADRPPAEAPATRIPLEDGRRIVYLQPEDLVSAAIEEGVVFVTRQEGDRLSYAGTLQDLEALLPAKDFLRSSRQEIVNIAQIKAMEPDADGGLLLQLSTGRKVAVSRRRARFFRALLG